MNNSFLKSDTPEVWTKEVYRNQQFMIIENSMIEAELAGDYGRLLKLARVYLRFQMEVMEQKIDKTKEDGTITKQTVYGVETPLFQKINQNITDLEDKWLQIKKKKVDPMGRANDASEIVETIREIENLQATLFHNNTALGLNYKKKNDPMKAAYS